MANNPDCPQTLKEYDRAMKPIREKVHQYWDVLYLNEEKVLQMASECLQHDLGLKMYVEGCSILFGPDIDLYRFSDLKQKLDEKYLSLKTNPKNPWDEIMYDYTLFVLDFYLSEYDEDYIIRMIDFQTKIEGADAFFLPEIWSLLASSYTERTPNEKSFAVLNKLEAIAHDGLNLHMLHLNRMFSYNEALRDCSTLYTPSEIKKQLYENYEKLYQLEDFNQNYRISKIGLMQADEMMVMNYLKWDQLKEADVALERLAKHIDKKNEAFYIRYFYYKAKGFSESKKKNFEEAEVYFKKALRVGVDSKDSVRVYDFYAKMLYDKGDYKKAYEINQKRENLEGKVYEKDKIEAVQMAVEKYQSEEKEKEIKLLSEMNQAKDESLSQKNIALFWGGIAFLLIGIVVYFLVRQNKLMSELKTVRLEQRLLRTQMNPHFIFNALATIEGLMLNDQIEEASEGITQFADLMRTILDNSREDFVSLKKELKVISSYVELQQLRFNNRFEFKSELINIDSTDEIQIPPMLIQPFVENAINHGFRKEEKTYNLKLSIEKIKEHLKIEIQDNGEGFEKRENPTNNRKSHSIQITKERLHILTQSTGKKSKLEVIQNTNGATGVNILIEIPLKKRRL